MKVAIHQPNFAPWLGYFHKFATADLFVFLDDAQFSKNSYTNRVKIRDDRWLTVPVSASLGTPINECCVANGNFRERLRGQLVAAYGKSLVVKDFIEVLAAVDSERLIDFNYATIEFLANHLGITTATARSSELGISSLSTDRLVEIVRSVGGTEYLSGAGGNKYQDPQAFTQAGIRLDFSGFEHPVYDQGGSAFTPGLSALDFLVATERANNQTR